MRVEVLRGAKETMGLRLKNPGWINRDLLHKNKPEEFPEDVFIAANRQFAQLLSDQPVVSIVIAAYNEEANIIRCLDSFSRSTSKYPLEIIVVDNNSDDRTKEVIKKFNVHYAFQKIQGCGITRQLGLETAKGKYMLTADADTVYPPDWINDMMAVLEEPGVVCVYGRCSFISDETTPRWKLTIYETLSDIMVVIKHLKRPYLNAYGMTMGYLREPALKAGYVQTNVRGEDGRLCFDLMKFGKVRRVMTNGSRVWTGTRTISKDGQLWNAMKNRIVMALANTQDFFTKPMDHDTKTSPSSNYDYQYNLKKLKRKLGLGKE